MKITRLSHNLKSDTPTYKNKNRVQLTQVLNLEKGDNCNKWQFTMNNHTGTHIDTPLHFCKSGKSIDQYPADYWFSNHVHLIQCKTDEIITHLEHTPKNTEVLLIKTGFENFRNLDQYVFTQPPISSELAPKLKSELPKLKFFGFDMISLSSALNSEMGHAAHKSFLCDYDIMIIEDMHLTELKSSPRSIIISPFIFEKFDGAPVTVFAYVD